MISIISVILSIFSTKAINLTPSIMLLQSSNSVYTYLYPHLPTTLWEPWVKSKDSRRSTSSIQIQWRRDPTRNWDRSMKNVWLCLPIVLIKPHARCFSYLKEDIVGRDDLRTQDLTTALPISGCFLIGSTHYEDNKITASHLARRSKKV